MPRRPTTTETRPAILGNRYAAAARFVDRLRTGKYPLTDAQRRALADRLAAPLDDEPQ